MARKELDKSQLPLASEQGRTLFASNRVIGLLDKEQRFDPMRPCRNGWLALRLLILPCCCSGLSFNSSLSRVVLPGRLNGRHVLVIVQKKVVLLTAAMLPSDKTPISLQYQPFSSDYPATLPPTHQHQNPLCCSRMLPTWASTKCLRPRANSPYFIPLTFLIAEGLGYQVKIPQMALYCREARAVSS
jgi:hypothetical protein